MCGKLKEEGEVFSQLPVKLLDFIHLAVSQIDTCPGWSFFSIRVYI